jgi:hypothetical protein
MYSFPPNADQEDVFTDFGGAHGYPLEFPPQTYLDDQWPQPLQRQYESHDMGGTVGEILSFDDDQVRLLFLCNRSKCLTILTQAPSTTEFEGTGYTNDYMYAPQPHAPQMYSFLAGGVPPNTLVSD